LSSEEARAGRRRQAGKNAKKKKRKGGTSKAAASWREVENNGIGRRGRLRRKSKRLWIGCGGHAIPSHPAGGARIRPDMDSSEAKGGVS
jgi:hypothetical protein